MLTRLIFILFLTVWWAGAGAQSKLTLPRYRHYTLRDGLSQMQVISIFQDSRGYIWVGTKAGLNCFNGEKFVSYTSRKFPEIANDHIKQICEDSFGRIWASTITGILQIDGNNLKFFEIDDVLNTWMAADSRGRMWFAKLQNSDFKVSIHCIEQDSVTALLADFPKSTTVPHVELKYEKEEDVLLLAIGNLLYRVKDGKSEVIHQNNSFIHFFPGTNKVLFSENTRKEIDTEDIYNFDIKNYQAGKIINLARIRDGKIIGNTGLQETLPYVCVSLPHSSYLITPTRIEYNVFEGIYTSYALLDREGNFWVGSEDGFYQPFGSAFSAYKQEFLPQIWAAVEDKDGALWFSSYLYGLYKYDGDKIEHYPSSYTNRVADFYFHPSIDKRGRLFFPNAFGILMKDGALFKQKGEQIYLSTFYDTERDLIWGGRGKGAVAFDANREKVRIIDEKSGLDVGKNVLTIGKDTSGHYWLGGGAGLARYNWETNSLKNYKPGDDNAGVYSQRNDYTGRTWFGTKNGLYWYDAKNDSLCKIERDELSDVVNMLEPIDSTWLIASQPYGIYLMDLQKYYRNGEVVLHLFNEKNGFTGIEPGQDGAYTDSKGNVWLTTSTELVKLEPDKLKIGINSQKLRIDKCNGQKLPFTSTNIELPRNQNSAVITFETICFNRPNPVQYSWKLEHDTVWSAWQEEDYAVISGLEDGLTKFEVRARIKGLPLSVPAQTDIGIRVRMAIYRQAWFFPTIFALISLIGIISLGATLLQMKRASREAKVFQMQAIQSQMNPHFIFNALASIQSMILKTNVSKANDYLVKLAELIRDFLEASLGTGSIKSPKDKEGQVPISSELKLLREFVEFQQVINPGKFDFEVTISDGFDVENEFIPPMLIQPFIENAIRHGILPSKRHGLMQLILEKIDGKIVITVRDNGIGIQNAERLIKKSPMRYTSRGKELTFQRIRLLNQLGFGIETQTESNELGTMIKIIINRQ